ncbi:hypothetical protein [Burkholderia ambifaria]|uniref:hypothetical protein n=1 Tax=Burkholderia ambifaria TaxID=152480 RepID=UPI0033929D38
MAAASVALGGGILLSIAGGLDDMDFTADADWENEFEISELPPTVNGEIRKNAMRREAGLPI